MVRKAAKSTTKPPTAPEKDGRDHLGRWLPGHTPDGATPFQPGESGNPGGMPSAGRILSAHLNAIAGAFEAGRLSADDLAKIAKEDPNGNRRIAARRFLNATRPDEDATGKLDPGKDFDRICDRTDGKPTQKSEVTVTHADAAAEVRARLLGKRGKTPQEADN